MSKKQDLSIESSFQENKVIEEKKEELIFMENKTKSEKTQETKVDLKPIEEWKKELGIKKYIYEPLLAFKKWQNGKIVTKNEFEKAIKDFYSAPVGGK